MATARDVARLAGTSPAVVSYVFNNGPRGVAASTRARVLAAAEELRYEPRTGSSGDSGARVPTVGLVLPSLRSPYDAEVARAVSDAAAGAGRLLLLAEARESGRTEARILQSLIAHKIDGLIVVALDDQPKLQSIMRYGLPVVELLGLPDHRASWSSVTIDYAHAAEVATRHLLQHGFDTIGLLNVPPSPVSRQHRRGFDAAVVEHGARVRTIQWRCELTQRAVTDLVADVLRRPDRPRAIYCATNLQASVVLRVAQRLNLTVPNDLAVIGFDGPNDPDLTIPPLTTVSEPFAELGTQALNLVKQRPTDGAPVHVVLVGDLVARQSCGCNSAKERRTRGVLPSSDQARGTRFARRRSEER